MRPCETTGRIVGQILDVLLYFALWAILGLSLAILGIALSGGRRGRGLPKDLLGRRPPRKMRNFD